MIGDLRMFEDDWQGVTSHDEEYLIENVDQITEALRKLNGDNKTTVAIIRDDTHSLTVGGGNDKRYVCYLTDGNGIYNLKTGQKTGSDLVSIVAGGQVGEFKPDLCVALEEATRAALYYAAQGGPDPGLLWEEV